MMVALVVTTCHCGARFFEDMDDPYGCCPGCAVVAAWCAEVLEEDDDDERR